MKQNRSIFGFLGLTLLCMGALDAKENFIGTRPSGCSGPTLCDVLPSIDGCGWSLEVGVLLEAMNVGNANLFYSHIDGTSDGTWNNPSRTSDQFYMGFDVSAGIKAGLGHTFIHEDWKFCAGFEWLSSTGSSSVEEKNAQLRPTFTPLLTFNLDGDFIDWQEAQSSIEIDYYLLDLAMKKGVYFSDTFSFESLSGIKLNWINYFTSLRLSDPSNTASGISDGTSWLSRNITEFWGVGPMVGFHSNYHVFRGWSVFSQMDLSILIGQTYIKDGNGFVTVEDYPGGVTVTNNVVMLSPAARTSIGLQYEKYVLEDTQHITLRIGFDGRWYYNQYPKVYYPASFILEDSEVFLGSGPRITEGNYFGMMGLLIDLCWSY